MMQTDDAGAEAQIQKARDILSELDNGGLSAADARDRLSSLFAARSSEPTYQKAWG